MTRAALALLAVALAGCAPKPKSSAAPPPSSSTPPTHGTYHVEAKAKLLRLPKVVTGEVTIEGDLMHTYSTTNGLVELSNGRKVELDQNPPVFSEDLHRACVVGESGTALAFVENGRISSVSNFYCKPAVEPKPAPPISQQSTGDNSPNIYATDGVVCINGECTKGGKK